MARPIRETPILFDARRFEKRAQNPPKLSEDQIRSINESYETLMRMMTN